MKLGMAKFVDAIPTYLKAGIGFVLCAALLLPMPWAAADGQISLTNGSPRFGQKITVSGSAFTPSQTATVALCGNNAGRGSKDCYFGYSSSGIDSDGRFSVDLIIEPPPVACPCVVSVSVRGKRSTIPIALPAFTPAEVAQPSATTSSARVVSIKIGNPRGVGGHWGNATIRPVGLVIENTGDKDINNFTAKLQWSTPLRGRSEKIESFPIQIPIGTKREISTEISLSPLMVGSLSVQGAIAIEGSEEFTTPAKSSVFIAPWLLILVIIVALQLWVLTVLRRNEVLRRNRKKIKQMEEQT